MELRIPSIENLAEHSYSTYNFALSDCHFKAPGVKKEKKKKKAHICLNSAELPSVKRDRHCKLLHKLGGTMEDLHSTLHSYSSCLEFLARS